MTGTTHFIEHLLFKGTPSRSARDISEAIEGIGGYLNAFTQEESTCYYARVPHDRFEDSMDVLTDMYRHACCTGEDVTKERAVILDEISMYRDQPAQHVEELLSQAMWHQHPLGQPIAGERKTVSKFTRRQIVSFLRRSYVPASTVVVVTGNVDRRQCVRCVRRQLGDMQTGIGLRCAPVLESTPQRAMSVEKRECEQTSVALGLRLFGYHDEDRYPLRLLNVVLGENMSSRLFQVVREERGLAYSIQSSVQLFNDTGALLVTAGMADGRSVDVIRLTAEELGRLRREPISKSELRRAKDYTKGQILLGLENTSQQMIWIGENLMSHGRYVHPDEVIRRLEAITVEEIQGVASRVLRRSRLSLSAIGTETGPVWRRAVNRALAGMGD
jgi:predicted Zn-dependent peptidase